MRVKELIEELESLDPELEVVVRGYEDGVDSVSSLELCKIKLNVFSEWYYGDHDVCDDGDIEAVQLES